LAGDFEHSAYREKLLEHLFVGEVLKCFWRHGKPQADFLRPEVDAGGYDIVITFGRITRHIQLKSCALGAKTVRQKVNIRLQDCPSGCVVWVVFEPQTFAMNHFLWFGGEPDKPLPSIGDFPVAKHSKGNARGEKLERPNIRILRRGDFERVPTIDTLVKRLFGDALTP
jgi:hypothetical protein